MSYKIGPHIKVYDRHDWGAKSPGAMSVQGLPVEAFIHYDSTPNAEQVKSLAAQKAVMREIQHYHQVNRGWSDIGYHFVVFQPYGNIKFARVFEARPVYNVPAAQLGHNTGTLAIQVYAGPGDKLKKSTEWAIIQLLRESYARKVRKLGGHRDVVATSCPGDVIYRRIPEIANRAHLNTYKSRSAYR